MALDSKTIKEEILDKDIYEANVARAKGESKHILFSAAGESIKKNANRKKNTAEFTQRWTNG